MLGSIYTGLTERLRTSFLTSAGTIAQLRGDLTRGYVSIRDYIACYRKVMMRANSDTKYNIVE